MEDKLTFLKENWYFPAIVAALLAMSFYGYFRSTQATAVEETPSQQAQRILRAQVAHTRTLRPPRPTEDEKTQQVIEQHQRKLEANPTAEDAPALLCATGNLYCRKLGNYEEAIHCYERVLLDYPEWPGNLRVYVNLANCYERTGEDDKARDIYRQMLKKFPEDSQEYMFAQAQLGY